MLEKVNSLEDLKKLNIEDKKILAKDIRKYILEIIRNSIKKWRTFSIKFRSCRTYNCFR